MNTQSRLLLVTLLLSILAAPSPASAQTPLDRHGLLSGATVHSDAFRDIVNPLSGNLLWVQTDLVLPGNAGLDLRVQRVYNSHIWPDYAAGSTELEEDSWAGIGWKLHFGRVINESDTQSGAAYIEMGDASRHALYSTTAYAEGWITQDFWLYDRASHTLKLPNGTVYTFGREVFLNARLGNVRYVTQISDPYGNRIEFEYFADPGPRDGVSLIRQILGAQTRTITFDYDSSSNALSHMHYDGRTWDYAEYPAGPAGYTILLQADGPGNPYGYKAGWGFEYDPSTLELTKVTGPSGGEWQYTYSDAIQQTAAATTRLRAVATRTVTGRSVYTRGIWTYSYGVGTNKDENVVDGPCNRVRYKFNGLGVSGDFSTWRAGLLAEQRIEQGWETYQIETFTWQQGEAISSAAVPASNGLWADDHVYPALLTQHAISRGVQTCITCGQGAQTWTTTLEYPAGNYNEHGQAWRITESGELTRVTTRTFQTGFTPYITSRVASETTTIGAESVSRSWTYEVSTGFVTSTTSSGFTTSFERSAEGNVSAQIDGLGNRTTFLYDWGAVREIRTPTMTSTFEINSDGSIHSETVAGLQTVYGYDPEGRQNYVKPPGGSAEQFYDYGDAFGRRLEKFFVGPTTPGGTYSPTEFYMDGFARPLSTYSANAGLWTDQTWDACSRTSGPTAPYADGAVYRAITTSYDPLSRVSSESTYPADATTSSQYLGNDVVITDAEGRSTRYNYNSFGSPDGGRLSNVIDAAGQQTSYTYDVRGNLLSVTGPGSTPTRTRAYDARGLLISAHDSESGTTTYDQYDANGNLLRMTDANGAVTTFRYDADNRLILRDAPGTEDDVSTTYDAAGRIYSMTSPVATTTFTYNAEGRPATRTDIVGGQSFGSSYTYDARGNLTRVDYPSGRVVTYIYDSADRLGEVRNNGAAFATSFSYDLGGRLASFVTGGVTHTLSYDLRDRVQQLRALGPGGGLDLTYSYDKTSLVRGITDPRGGMSQSYGYDALSRLTSATGPWSPLSWTYDATGNRRTETRGGSTTTYGYDSVTQRLQSTSGSSGSESFTYTTAGQLATDGVGTYTYNTSGLLRTFSGGGTTATYQYDPAGLRISKSINGTTTYSARSVNAQTLSELEDACGVKRWKRDFIYAGSRLLGAVAFNRPAATVAFAISSSSVGEAAGTATLQVRLITPDGAPLPCALTVSYATANGTATSGADYTAASSTVTFTGGSPSGSTRSITISIANDNSDEANETFTVSLSNPQGGVLGATTQHTVTIVDDDDPPTNQPPTVAWTAPAAGASFTAPATIQLTATASDADGTIGRVEFYANGTLLQQDTSSPYSYSWTNVGEGSYTLSAVAIDNGGATTTSTRAITVTTSGGSYVLMADDFNDNVLDTTKWDTTDLFSGTQDGTITVAESAQRLNIGPLRANTTGIHYNGIDSQNAYDFTGAAAYVELVQPSSYGATAFAMLTVGKDSNNYYRLFVSGTTLTAEKKIAGTKDDLSISYDATADRYLRIRHDALTGRVLWETAPSGGAQPGAWTIRRYETWNTTAVPLGTVRFELKAGTSDAQVDPGTVIFDNFKAYRTGGETPTEIVIYASDVPAPQGGWLLVADPSAAAGAKLATTNQNVLTSPALAAPASYFDVPFNASAGVRYRVWLRLHASGNSTANDSVWVQFSDSLNQLGQAVYRLGTSGALGVNLENCTGCGVSGWGWQTSAYFASDTGEVWFATSGTHMLRIQVREDGVELDQIVLSAAQYVDMSPGPAIADATIVPRADSNDHPIATLTSPSAGATFTAPASIVLSATASDLDGIARIDFYANGASIGAATASPYTATWPGAAAGTYLLTAVATDTRGATSSTPARAITVYPASTAETILIADDFNDNTLDTAKWDTTDLFSGTQDATIPVAETGSQIRIGPLLSNTSGTHYNGLDTQLAYDFTGAAASVELVQPASTGVTAYAMLTVGIDSNNYYRLFVSGTTLVAQRKIGGTKNDVTFTYDATAHRFLRIRHNAANGEVVWETAPSVGGLPGTWTALRHEAWNTAAVPVTAVRFELKAGTSDAQPSPGTVIFDNFKAARGTDDDTVLLWEDFSAPSLNASTWAVAVQSGSQDPSIPVTQSGSHLTIGPLLTSASGSHYNGILSQATFDLTGAAVSAEAVAVPSTDTRADLMLTLTVDNQHHYRAWVEQGFLRFEQKTPEYGKEAVGDLLLFDATEHAFWRIRHDPITEQMVFETAPRVSGIPGQWVEHGRVTRAFAITATRIELKAGTWQPETTAPGSGTFDSVKVVR